MPDDANQAISDARLLLDDFVTSAWRSLEIACGSMRLTISRIGAAERAALLSRPGSPPIGEDEEGELLTAPHLATVREVAAAGSTIQAGQAYATLELLDEPIVLRAARSVRIVSVLSRPGDLLEFGSPLIAVAPGPGAPGGAGAAD